MLLLGYENCQKSYEGNHVGIPKSGLPPIVLNLKFHNWMWFTYRMKYSFGPLVDDPLQYNWIWTYHVEWQLELYDWYALYIYKARINNTCTLRIFYNPRYDQYPFYAPTWVHTFSNGCTPEALHDHGELVKWTWMRHLDSWYHLAMISIMAPCFGETIYI